MENLKTNLEWALYYRNIGWSPFPLVKGSKNPAVGWKKYQTEIASEEELSSLWKEEPEANIGIVTGKISGFFVFDIDAKHNRSSKEFLIPPTVCARTGGGGEHFYFKLFGEHIQNSAGQIFGVGVDIRANGGFVVVPPSLHASGNNYEWIVGPDEIEIAEAPEWLKEKLFSDGSRTESRLDIKEIAGAEHGSRNDNMHRLACSLFSKGYSDNDVVFIAGEINKTYNPPLGQHQEDKPDEFEKILISAKNFIASEKKRGTLNNPGQKSSGAIIDCLADIKSEPIKWLWPDRLALGKLSMFSGDPGLGKSLIGIAIAAVVSNQSKQWPVDKTESPHGDVIFLSAEDDSADMIKPRLEAAGADCSHVHILKAVQIEEKDYEGNNKSRMFSLKNDIEVLEKAFISFPNCKVLIIDPISAYLDGTDSHANADVRGLLTPLIDLAARHKVAVIAINHLNKSENTKNSLYRSIGSIGFIATARTAFLVTEDKDSKEEPPRVLVLFQKSNISKLRTGFAYSVHATENDAPFIKWEDELVTMTANQVSASDKKSEESEEWEEMVLKDILASGPKPATVVIKEAKEAGIKEKPLRRIAEKLAVKHEKQGVRDGWCWVLPPNKKAEGGQDTPSNIEDNLDILANQ